MTETLYIRLGSNASDKIHWLIFSSQNKEIIASGELSNSEQLIELTEKSQQRKVTILVPGCDVALKSINVPGNSQAALRAATPYMLEDELAQDVEQLFFAYCNLKTDQNGNNCFVAVVEREQMQHWQAWLAQADIKYKKLLPDVLAMPLVDDEWTAIKLGEQILIRQSQWQGLVVDENTWQVLAQQWAQSIDEDESNNPIKVIHSYSEIDSECQLNLNAMPEELPLALLAKHCEQQTFNLLQGEFKLSEKRSPAMVNWFWAAGIAVFAVLLNFTIKGVQLAQLNSQQQAIEQEIIQTYKKAFPQSKRVRVATIKSQLKRKLSELGSSGGGEGFLMMLDKVQPAFAKVSELKPESIKFDGKRQEIRLQATAKDYQHFEQFKIELEKSQLSVSQGAQSNQGDEVSGSFSIRAENTTNKKRGSKS